MEKTLAEIVQEFHLEALVGTVEELKRPCIKGEFGMIPLKKGQSKVGGLPDMAGDFKWPVHNDKPLSFIAQLNLAEFQHDLLPAEGLLYFFYDLEAWGFDPQDAGFIKVMYREPGGELETVKAPSYEAKVLFGLKTKQITPLIFGEHGLTFYEGYSLPSSEHKDLAQLLEDDALSDNYCDAKERLTPMVQVFGYPNPLQGDSMQLECQLVSNGLYCGDATGYKNPRAKELEAGKEDWVLLLQLGEHPEADMTWSDAGMLYFWIRKQDLAARHFDKTWLILQCC